LSPSAITGMGQKHISQKHIGMTKQAIIGKQPTVAASAPRRLLRRLHPALGEGIDLSSICAGALICLTRAPKCKSILGFRFRLPGTRQTFAA
jgi:hypothetical protein